MQNKADTPEGIITGYALRKKVTMNTLIKQIKP